ncbi:hypothetical protein [Micromonospora cathayae]|uniref:Glycine rich protein n=1 Tax=Micromonospora cathayae TaxID=3028804 RepID=A0ABY7ZKV2_9ACTN|nr:hypothetical protein [Micromonospora sp. HUAS 3]WDZ83615.1 hypothetical protein PVK37_24590 [Micromonospora sp. HUAS 3]
MRTARRAFLLAAGLTALAVPLVTVPAQALTPAAAEIRMPECAWSAKYGVNGLNAYWPDTAATYWSTIYPVTGDLEVTISGVFPDARYASFNVYDEKPAQFTRNGVASSLPDYLIVPDPGSVNPWRTPGTSGGRFTVTLSPEVTVGEVNRLPLSREDAPAGAKASVIFRVYLPTGGDAAVVLPTVTLTQGGVSTTLPPCAAGTGNGTGTVAAPLEPPGSGTGGSGRTGGGPGQPGGPGHPGHPGGPGGPGGPGHPGGPGVPGHPGHPGGPGGPGHPDEAGEKLFRHTSEVENLAPNPDNAYLGAWIAPPGAENVVVIRGRAPRAVAGTHPEVWPRRKTDLRYWSMCTNLGGQLKPVVINRPTDGPASYGCRYDDETSTDRHGHYTFVLGTEAQRPAIEAVPGVTFLPFSTSYPTSTHMVLLRNLIPVDGFPHAVQNVPLNSSAETAAEVMGPYYPLVRVCGLADLASRGPRHCAA